MAQTRRETRSEERSPPGSESAGVGSDGAGCQCAARHSLPALGMRGSVADRAPQQCLGLRYRPYCEGANATLSLTGHAVFLSVRLSPPPFPGPIRRADPSGPALFAADTGPVWRQATVATLDASNEPAGPADDSDVPVAAIQPAPGSSRSLLGYFGPSWRPRPSITGLSARGSWPKLS